MSERRKDFLYNLLFGGIIAAAVFVLNYNRGYLLMRCICDAFFVAAVLLLGVGGIKGVRNKGAFDIMGYGVKSTLELIIPMLRKNEKEDLYGYRERKEADRKSAGGMLLAGVVYLGLSVIALILYYWVK